MPLAAALLVSVYAYARLLDLLEQGGAGRSVRIAVGAVGGVLLLYFASHVVADLYAEVAASLL